MLPVIKGYTSIFPGVYATEIRTAEPLLPISLLMMGQYQEPTAVEFLEFMMQEISKFDSHNPHSILSKRKNISTLEKEAEKQLPKYTGLAQRITFNHRDEREEAISYLEKKYPIERNGSKAVLFTLARIHPLAYLAFIKTARNPATFYRAIDEQTFEKYGEITSAEVLFGTSSLSIPDKLTLQGDGPLKEKQRLQVLLTQYFSGIITASDIQKLPDASERVLKKRMMEVLPQLNNYISFSEQESRSRSFREATKQILGEGQAFNHVLTHGRIPRG